MSDRIIYPLPYFDGGLNTKYSSHLVADNESPDCLNVDLDDAGRVKTRNGSRVYASHTTLGTGTWYGIANYQPTTAGVNSILVGFYNSSAMYMSGNTFVTIPSSIGVFDSNRPVAHMQYDNYLFMSDGVRPPYKWNGTEFTRMGVEVPAAPAVTTAVTAGLLNGAYSWKVTYVNSALVEGDVGSAVSLSIVSGIASLTAIPTAPVSYGVARRYIYRTQAGGSVYYLTGQLNDNTTTTFKDTTADTSLVVEAPEDQGKPPLFTKVTKIKDRLFFATADEAILYYSEIGVPYVVKVTNTELIGKGDGKIRALGIHQDAVFIAKDTDNPYLLFLADNDPTNFLPVRTNASYSTLSPLALNYGDKVMYLGNEGGTPTGFVGLSGINPLVEGIATDSGTTQSDSISFRIQPNIAAFAKAYLDKVQGVVWKQRALISVPSTTSSTDNDKIYVYDYVRRDFSDSIGGWFPWSGLGISYFVIYNNKLLGTTTGEAVGKVLELDVDGLLSDSGSAIDSYYATKFLNNKKHVQNHKDFRTLYLRCALTGTGPLNIYRKTDFLGGNGDLKQVSLSTTSSLYDTAVYDLSIYDGGFTEKEFDLDLGKSNGRRIQFKFTNGNIAGQGFKIAEGAIEYILRTRRNHLR